MEEKQEIFGMLDLMLRPGFCVRENQILHVNAAAQGLPFSLGGDVRSLLMTGVEEYENLTDGCLYLKLAISSNGWGAIVTRMDQWDIFLLDPMQNDSALQAMALAARDLRRSLSCIMIAAQRMSPLADAHAQEQVARLNRGVYQMLRTISNMSDAGRYAVNSCQELCEIGALFSEILEKGRAVLESIGIGLDYQGLAAPVYTLADREQLERAILNLLSNAAKASAPGGRISVSLSRTGRLLRLCVLDDGCGIDPSLRSGAFQRYLRQPSIEDSQQGIGLGMVLIRSAAANHGGTVLIDQPGETGTRVTMTMVIRDSDSNALRSPILRPDYAGGWDHALVEFSDILPLEAFWPEP